MLYINPLYFLVAFAIGILYTYLSTPPIVTVVKYPTPDNAGQITYRDQAGVCYRYRVVSTACPANPHLIYRPPIGV
jgi:hypothetical protein